MLALYGMLVSCKENSDIDDDEKFQITYVPVAGQVF